MRLMILDVGGHCSRYFGAKMISELKISESKQLVNKFSYLLMIDDTEHHVLPQK